MKKIVCTTIIPFLFLLIWHNTAAKNIFSPLILPSPQAVWHSFIEILTKNELSVWPDALRTLYRMFAGLFLGIALGVPLGLGMGYLKTIYQLFEFPVDFLRSIPATALIPLFLLILGLGEVAKISLVALVVTLLVCIHTTYGLRHAEPTRLLIGKTMCLKTFQIFRHILLPEALPHISIGIRIALSFSIILVIVTEMFIGTTYGLGRRILDAQLVYRTSEMYALIFFTGLLGYALNSLYLSCEKKWVHWAGK